MTQKIEILIINFYLNFLFYFKINKWWAHIQLHTILNLTMQSRANQIYRLRALNPHLHRCVSNHRDEKYFGEVSFWPAEYRNRPPKVPLISNFKNFGEFHKSVSHQTGNVLFGCIFCFVQLKHHWNKIIFYKYTNKVQIYECSFGEKNFGIINFYTRHQLVV